MVRLFCRGCLSTTCTTFVRDASPNTGVTVTGLTNGSVYTFKVAAVNAAGTGEAGTSGAFTPRRAPDAPTTVLSVVDNTGGVDVSWTAPANTGGNAISDYTLQSCVVDVCTTFTRAATTAISVKVTGLTKGTAYTFQVAAVNAAGTGVYSAKSSPAVVPRAVPGTPLNFMVAADDKQANLSWDAPANNGDVISDYVVKSCRLTTCTEFVHEPSSNTTITVTGLSNGTGYTFKVAAKNAAGVGGEATSGGVTPRTVAGAPTGVAGTPGDRRVDLTWTAPVDTGGAAVADYVVQSCIGNTCTTFVDAVSSARAPRLLMLCRLRRRPL